VTRIETEPTTATTLRRFGESPKEELNVNAKYNFRLHITEIETLFLSECNTSCSCAHVLESVKWRT